MIYFICIIHLHIFHGNIWTQNWPAPNVSGFIAQLVEHRTGIARSRVQALLKSWIFFRLLYAIVKIASITARIILHLTSYPQFTYDLFHMHHSLNLYSKKSFSWKVNELCGSLGDLYILTFYLYELTWNQAVGTVELESTTNLTMSTPNLHD